MNFKKVLSLCFLSVVLLAIFSIVLNFLYSDKLNAKKINFIGMGFKSLAKSFILCNDLGKLKSKYIVKLKSMNQEKFKMRYLKIYNVLKELPLEVREKNGINADMTKEQVIAKLGKLNKRELYDIVDEVPNELIYRLFERFGNKYNLSSSKYGLDERISRLWDKIVKNNRD